MIKVENTQNLMGISIKGDYNDLQELREAIGNYIELYHMESLNIIDRQLKSGEITEEQKRLSYIHYSDMKDCISGLNYDIRHAYQGNRNFEFVENGSDNVGRLAECLYQVDEEVFEQERRKGEKGNLYYSVDILYPWAIYYLINFSAMLDNWYYPESLNKLELSYTEIQCRRYRCIIELFCMKMWECIGASLGNNKTENIFELIDALALEAKCGSYYGEALCNYYCDQKKSGRKLRKAMLEEIFYEFIDLENMMDYISGEQKAILGYCKKNKAAADQYIREKTGQEFLKQSDFAKKHEAYFKEHNQYGSGEREEFIDQFGDVDWDKLKW